MTDLLLARVATDVVEQLQATVFPAKRGEMKLPTIVYNVNGKNRLSARLDLQVDHLNNNPDGVDLMSYEDKRALIESVMNGETSDGRDAAVYIHWKADKNGQAQWGFAIRGIIETKAKTNAGKRGRSECASR